ncbi:hypothetical protein CY34DRAFT_515562 [Suillus luteus UH-Slu-Lm8-n1]|uniref:Uncharacterized protein n=1 Tax=Suillus luteus UH-Slu-Lm8-n1 TaxID=930992 RepID=A0A0D0C1V3_9AGAM|nr:hypothetical protein CY34DRAFT_515562 [Suillus luteus UH-Slu-Lm8-n1]
MIILPLYNFLWSQITQLKYCRLSDVVFELVPFEVLYPATTTALQLPARCLKMFVLCFIDQILRVIRRSSLVPVTSYMHVVILIPLLRVVPPGVRTSQNE